MYHSMAATAAWGLQDHSSALIYNCTTFSEKEGKPAGEIGRLDEAEAVEINVCLGLGRGPQRLPVAGGRQSGGGQADAVVD